MQPSPPRVQIHSTTHPPVQDQDQINQILAETKQVLSSTVSSQQASDTPSSTPQKYSDLVRRNSAMQGTQMAQSPHSPFQRDHSPGNGPPPQSPASNSPSGFLLNPRRRTAANGNLPLFQRNSSIFVRDVPNNIEEKNLREVLSIAPSSFHHDWRRIFLDASRSLSSSAR